MSNVPARFFKPTGLEFHDTAFEIDKEIWKFIKNEYKNKTKAEEGNLPVRYWQTHGVLLHRECWSLIGKITYANSIYPTNEDELKERKRYQQEAIGHCQKIFQMLRLTVVEIPSLDANKLERVLELLGKECELLRSWKRSSKIMVNKKNKSATA